MLVLCLLLLFGAVFAKELSDEEYYQLPELFHLDDYERCFLQSNGEYCLGTFHLTPNGEPNSIYGLMEKHTSEPYTFNRTLIHRGYCLNTRCPDLNATQGSIALRFEYCAARWAKPLLQAQLLTLHYCRSNAETRIPETRLPETLVPETRVSDSLKAAKLIYLVVICALLLLNIIGTIYDARTKNKGKKIEILMVWSVRKNWKALTSTHKKGPSTPLAALHGIRVGITLCVCLTHSGLLHFMIYANNPRALERIVSHPLAMIIQNSTAGEQMLFVITGFLQSVQLRQRSDTPPISLNSALLITFKRIFRLFPVFILVVGFAATWWPSMSSGPMWPAIVEAESAVCRQKFWTHVLFVNNIVEPEKFCILSTWYMAVDVQLYIVSTILLVVLSRFHIPQLPVLVVLFIGSCLLNAGLSYAFDWKPMLYLTTSPENLRTVFREQPSFAGLYISPWGNLPACLLGLILGYLYYRMKGNRWDVRRFKWLLILSSIISAPLLLGWILIGYFLQHVKAKPFVVAYTALERSIFQVFCLVYYVALSIASGFMIKVMAWRGWHAMSRMSYPVMLVHWLVNVHIVASTPQPLTSSVMDIGIHGFITALYTFVLAIPITILIEMPMKKVFDIITT